MIHQPAVFATVLLLAACAGPSSTPEAPPAQPTSTTHSIGVVMPLSAGADGAEYGENELKGMKLAVEELNGSQEYHGDRFELLVEDDAGDPATAVAATRRLLAKGVPVVVGSLLSSNALAQAPILEEARVIHLLPGASSPRLSGAGDYVFRIWPSDDLQGRAAAEALRSAGIDTAAVLYVNNDFGQGLLSAFTTSFEGAGGKVLASESYEANQASASFRTQLSKLVSTQPEVLYVVSYPAEAPIVLKEAWEAGFGGAIFGTEAFETADFGTLAPPENLAGVGPLARRVLYATAATPDPSAPRTAAFRSAYRSKYHEDPGMTADYGYDAIMLIGPMLVEYHDDSTRIKDALYRVDTVGATGRIAFDENGDILGSFTVKEYRDGTRLEFKENQP